MVLSTCIVSTSVGRDPTFGVYSPTASDGQNTVRSLQWPVPVIGSGHTLQIQTPEDVAVDTQRGGIFEPHDCAGNEPAICRLGPIYGRGRLLCTRGILNGDVIQHASCLFTAARETSPEGYAEEIAPAMYAISTYGEGYSIHCRGKPEIRQHMEIGIFILRVAADCRVQGQDWTLPGVAHLHQLFLLICH